MTYDSSTNKKHDNLNLAKNEDIRSMLIAEGVNNEAVVYSELLTKINRKGKKQSRVLLLTNKAVYNLKPGKYTKSLRRINLSNVGMITLSNCSSEFAIHVPTEYDYHLSSKNQMLIANTISTLFKNETKEDLMQVESELKNLNTLILTQKLAQYEVEYFSYVLCFSISLFVSTEYCSKTVACGENEFNEEYIR